jgi:hypothetical protein
MKNRIIPVLLLILLTLGSSVFGQTILAGRGISISVQGVPPEEKGRIDSPAVSVSALFGDMDTFSHPDSVRRYGKEKS